MNKKQICKFFLGVIIAIIIFFVLNNIIFSNNNIERLNISEIIYENVEESEVAQAELKIEVKNAKVPTLMYHSITDDMSYIEYSINAVSPVDFEKQLKYISENGYQTIFFDDLENLGKYTKPIILTFDDGFVDFYKEAFPLLKKYNQKATLFVVVGYISCDPYCTVEHLKEMEESGLVDVQVHTQSHKNLTTLDKENLEKEVVGSKEILEGYLNKNVTSLCYPYGAYNKTTTNLVSKNYSYAITMDEGCYDVNLHTYQNIPRYTIPRGLSIDKFVNYISKSFVEIKK